MVRGGLVKWEIVKLFLATETYNHFVSHKQKQQSGAQPACRSCTKLDQGLFDCLFLFLLSLAVFSAVVLFPPSLSFREQEKWGLPVMGHCQRRVRNLVCLVAVLQSSYPEAWFHPCLYCCSHQGQSWLSITLSQLRCNHLKFWRKPHSRVSYPLRCIFFCRKLICLSWFRHCFLFVRKNTVTIIIFSQEMGKRFGKRQAPWNCPFWDMSEMHSVCSLFWLPRRCLRGHLTLNMQGIW